MTTPKVDATWAEPSKQLPQERRWWRPDASTVVVLAVLVVVGALIRSHGFTAFDLWFDDAWAAAPARVGWSSAVHMVLTAPGYSLALRAWIRLDPTTSWWAQLPAFVLGIAAIPAVWALLRRLQLPGWSALAAAAAVAVGPLAVQYSTRVKEYPFDLLAACVLLVLADRVRVTPSARNLVVLSCGSVVAFAMSAGCAPVIAGVWLAAMLACLGHRDRWLPACAAAAGAVAGCGAVWALFLRHIPSILSFNWRRRGFLVDYRSLSLAERTLTLIFGGFVHAVFAYPVPSTFFSSHRGLHTPSAALVGVVLLCAAIGTAIVQSWRRRVVTASLPSALALLIAVALAVGDVVPLGDGRTDEALYPALFVGLAAVAVSFVRGRRANLAQRVAAPSVRVAVAAALLVAVVVFGLSHRAVYPSISLRGIAAKVLPLQRHGDVLFVDTFNSFGWCYYELAPCTIKIGGHPVWPQGFRPVATSPDVFIASHYGIPLPEFTAAQASARRIWYVGYTFGTFDVGTSPARYNLPVPTFFTGLLCRDGWRPARASTTTVVFGLHTYALLFVRGQPQAKCWL